MTLKKVVFYTVTYLPLAVVIAAIAGVLLTSARVHRALAEPDQGDDSKAMHYEIARHIYYNRPVVNTWQSMDECIDFDPELLYVPSDGCEFTNPEFDTVLSFDQKGRIHPSLAPRNGPPVLFLGDSVTMGWGVNDAETFVYHIAASLSVPVFNLGVSSYGTVREIRRALRHPYFDRSRCVVIQYSNNDYEENLELVESGALPPPTMERYEQLLSWKRREASYLQVLWNTTRYFANRYLGVGSASETGDAQVSMKQHARVFIQVLAAFPELAEKRIFVFGPVSGALAKLPDGPDNLVPLRVAHREGSFYVLDGHLTPAGHRQVGAEILRAIRDHCDRGTPELPTRRITLGRKETFS